MNWLKLDGLIINMDKVAVVDTSLPPKSVTIYFDNYETEGSLEIDGQNARDLVEWLSVKWTEMREE